MILDYIEHMREQPRPVRKRFVFLVTLGITIIIAAVWAVTVYMRFSFSELLSIGEFGEESIANISSMKDVNGSALQDAVDMQALAPEESKEAIANMAEALSAMGGASTTEDGAAEASSAEMQAPQMEVPITPPPPAKRAVIIATTSSETQVR